MPFVDETVLVDEVVVADVAPAAAAGAAIGGGIGVEGPNGAHGSGPVAAGIARNGVMHNHVAGVVVSQTGCVITIDRGTPDVPADDGGARVGRAVWLAAVGGVECHLAGQQFFGGRASRGVDEGEADAV